jgi:hypothetical protein
VSCFIAGAVAVLLVAQYLQHHIYRHGEYGVSPSYEWALATGLSMGGSD